MVSLSSRRSLLPKTAVHSSQCFLSIHSILFYFCFLVIRTLIDWLVARFYHYHSMGGFVFCIVIDIPGVYQDDFIYPPLSVSYISSGEGGGKFQLLVILFKKIRVVFPQFQMIIIGYLLSTMFIKYNYYQGKVCSPEGWHQVPFFVANSQLQLLSSISNRKRGMTRR